MRVARKSEPFSGDKVATDRSFGVLVQSTKKRKVQTSGRISNNGIFSLVNTKQPCW